MPRVALWILAAALIFVFSVWILGPWLSLAMAFPMFSAAAPDGFFRRQNIRRSPHSCSRRWCCYPGSSGCWSDHGNRNAPERPFRNHREHQRKQILRLKRIGHVGFSGNPKHPKTMIVSLSTKTYGLSLSLLKWHDVTIHFWTNVKRPRFHRVCSRSSSVLGGKS